MASAGKAFKVGCLGCLGVVGLVLLVGAVVTFVAWSREKNVEFTSSEEVVPVPAAPAALEAAGELPTGGTGRIDLDIVGVSEVLVVPCEPGEEMKSFAEYDPKRYRYEESFENSEDGGWHYRVDFKGEMTMLSRMLQSIFSKQEPRFRLCLPRDQLLALDFEVEAGGLEAELGGLHLQRTEVGVAQGGLELAFREPLEAPMEELKVDISMGGGAVMAIGNASPGAIDLNMSMGGMAVDFGGNWLNDTDISLDHSMSGIELMVPQALAILGAPVSGSQQEGAFQLRFKEGTTFDDKVSISRR